jgi:hypothetical protein
LVEVSVVEEPMAWMLLPLQAKMLLQAVVKTCICNLHPMAGHLVVFT